MNAGMNDGTALVLWVCLGLAGLAVAVSALILFRMHIERRRLRAARGWPAAAGRMADVRVDERHVPEFGPQYMIALSYAYEVGGRRYAGGRIALGPPQAYSLRRSAERRAAAYRPGMAVTVYYDPADPAQAVLQRRAPFFPVLVMLLAAVWIVTAGGIGVMLLAPGVVGAEPVVRL